MSLEQRALRALDEGPEGFGSGPGQGQAVTVGRWIGERHAAVLFIRRRHDGRWDATAVHATGSDHAWKFDLEAGGPCPDRLDRPSQGWDGSHIDSYGESGHAEVLVFRGQVSGSVETLILDPDVEPRAIEIDPLSGAYVAGNEGRRPLRLVAHNVRDEIIDEVRIPSPDMI